MTTVTFTKTHVQHVRLIEPQAEQLAEAAFMITDAAAEVFENSICFTAWVDHRPIGAAGVIDLWQNRAMCWALVAKGAGPYMLPITRYVRRVLDLHPAKRIEATTLHDFTQGHRWLRTLGFVCETPCKAHYYPDGRAVAEYVRLK